MAETPTLTAFSIRKDGVEVKQPSGTMNSETLSLVKLAQEMCNSGANPQDATTRLLDLARSEPALRFLQEADQDQAIAELERRFSGCTTKPWEVQP